jgi:hypothetical protein
MKRGKGATDPEKVETPAIHVQFLVITVDALLIIAQNRWRERSRISNIKLDQNQSNGSGVMR